MDTVLPSGGPRLPPAPPAVTAPPSARQLHAAFSREFAARHRRLALLLGGLLGGLAGFFNTATGLALVPFVGLEDVALAVVAVVVAPVVEEPVKLLALRFLHREEGASYPRHQWVVLGALAGAGFGLAEAALYFVAILPVHPGLAAANLGLRLALTVPLHAFTVTLTAEGYARLLAGGGRAPLARRLVAAVLLHATWNGWQVLQAWGMGP